MRGQTGRIILKRHAKLNSFVIAGARMKNLDTLVKGSILLAFTIFSSACVIAEPREGYYDHDHARYYHEHTWHECGGEHNEYCR
jgi:hypothetical protein